MEVRISPDLKAMAVKEGSKSECSWFNTSSEE